MDLGLEGERAEKSTEFIEEEEAKNEIHLDKLNGMSKYIKN